MKTADLRNKYRSKTKLNRKKKSKFSKLDLAYNKITNKEKRFEITTMNIEEKKEIKVSGQQGRGPE